VAKATVCKTAATRFCLNLVPPRSTSLNIAPQGLPTVGMPGGASPNLARPLSTPARNRCITVAGWSPFPAEGMRRESLTLDNPLHPLRSLPGRPRVERRGERHLSAGDEPMGLEPSASPCRWVPFDRPGFAYKGRPVDGSNGAGPKNGPQRRPDLTGSAHGSTVRPPGTGSRKADRSPCPPGSAGAGP